MSSTKLIRNRIKAIQNTAKITKAMEMVAASKMKKAEDSTLKNRPYSEATYEVIFNLARQQSISHPYLNINPKASRYLLVVISSDKGLCGSFNAAIARIALEYIRQHEPIDLITIGKKGQNYFKRLNQNILATYINFPVHPREADIRPIIHSITEQFLSDQYKEVAVVYTDFRSILRQVPNLITLLPLGAETASMASEPSVLKANRAGEPQGQGRAERLDPSRSLGGTRSVSLTDAGERAPITIKFEPSPKEVINFVIPRILEIKLYQMILESIASEQAARMLAMKNATESANELVDELNLTYNSVRQANITQELAEISAGAHLKERIE